MEYALLALGHARKKAFSHLLFRFCLYFLLRSFTAHRDDAGSHPHDSSTTKTSPHSSHLYFVPFFAIHLHLLTILLHKNLPLLLDIRLFDKCF